jgi:hypothetical protein
MAIKDKVQELLKDCSNAIVKWETPYSVSTKTTPRGRERVRRTYFYFDTAGNLFKGLPDRDELTGVVGEEVKEWSIPIPQWFKSKVNGNFFVCLKSGGERTAIEDLSRFRYVGLRKSAEILAAGGDIFEAKEVPPCSVGCIFLGWTLFFPREWARQFWQSSCREITVWDGKVVEDIPARTPHERKEDLQYAALKLFKSDRP